MSPDGSHEHSSFVHCAECGAPLAHDQRYCVQCGARRAGLPALVAGLLAGIVERGRRVASPSRPEGEPLVPQAHWYDSWVQAPRAAAVSVLSMLGFGVIVGSLVTGASALQPLLIAVAPATQSALTGAGAGGGAGGGGSGSGGGAQTITVTTPAPATPGSGGLGGSSVGGIAGGGTGGATGPSGPTNGAPPIKHVFMIMLSNQGFNATFGHSANDPYLAQTLVKKGELVLYYYAVAGGSLANEVGLVSGQGPTPNTVNNCPKYTDVFPADKGPHGQVLGTGCVYPKTTQTFADQLAAVHLGSKVYIQTKGTGKRAQLEVCRRPRIGASDRARSTAQDPYVTWRNPFLYFQSSLAGSCAKRDVPLGQLTTDLKSAKTTPALSYIVADTCHDGSDTPCGPGAKAGPAAADEFLKSVVPQILRSPAYKADGLVAITYDQAPQTGPSADPSSCCGTPSYPNLLGFGGPPAPTGATGPSGATGATGPAGANLGAGQSNPTGGGGRVGLLLLSRYVQPGIPDVTDYFNHFSLLASIENSFGFAHLGYASVSSLPFFGPAVWTAFAG